MRPVLGFVALIAAAFVIMLISTRSHPVNPEQVPEDPAASQSSSTQTTPPVKSSASSADAQKEFDAVKAGAVHITMVVENRGTLGLELYPKAAPKTVAHFVELCRQHFYDGLLFHRYVPGFVIQGGDPKSKEVKSADIANIPAEQAGSQYGLGSGGSGKTVPLEVSLHHWQNTLGLARSAESDSGDSQFFINLADNSNLDTGYCAFGRVVQGQDIVPQLRQGDRITSMTVAP